jgi:phosphoribosylamine--glycine ligase
VARSVPEAQEAARRFGDGVVIKADGLAAGKGVVVCGGLEEAEAAIDRIMAKSEFGAAGDRVVVERRLSGTELSLIAVSDGERYRLMIPAQDHKQLGDGDRGPNTGGMGAYAPAPRIAPPELVGRVEREVIQRTLQGMRDEGFPLTGVLYAGLMIDQEGRPQVLEFNVRFGDPETQPQMMMLGSDLAELMVASDGGDVSRVEVEWREGAAVTVVAAAQGYPSSPRKGDPIEGIEEAERGDDRIVFHAGTALVDGRLVVAGGRVLGVTARAADLASARAAAYEMMEAIGFRGMHYRTDIAEKGL